jgi:hypothetical protein
MCEITDGDGKQFSDLEPAITECQGLGMEIPPYSSRNGGE